MKRNAFSFRKGSTCPFRKGRTANPKEIRTDRNSPRRGSGTDRDHVLCARVVRRPERLRYLLAAQRISVDLLSRPRRDRWTSGQGGIDHVTVASLSPLVFSVQNVSNVLRSTAKHVAQLASRRSACRQARRVHPTSEEMVQEGAVLVTVRGRETVRNERWKKDHSRTESADSTCSTRTRVVLDTLGATRWCPWWKVDLKW